MSLLDKAIKENCGCGEDDSNNLLSFLIRRNQAEEEESMELDSEQNPTDAVTMDVPLLIRMFEFMREEVKDDETIHNVTQKLVKLAASGEPLTMDNYNEIVG